jgi:sugar phosphate isomerase/epimerase
MKPGLVSVTFRQLSPQKIAELCVSAGLQGIEWGGDVHVPHGDRDSAREVLSLTRNAGLEVAAYGSYYRVGKSEQDGLSFDDVLQTAVDLGAPTIRVWAGTKNSEDADEEYFSAVAGELRRICDLAAAQNIRVATEFHGNTLTNTASSAHRLLTETDHPNLRTLWQVPVGDSPAEALRGLHSLHPHLLNVHVFQWLLKPEGLDRRPLEEGAEVWQEYFAAARDKAQWALLEFVAGDDPAQLLRDAATLNRWL